MFKDHLDIKEGRKEIFYLIMHSTHYTVTQHRKHGKGPFRYLEKNPAAATSWATLSDYQQGFFYMHHPTDRTVYLGWNDK